MASNTPSAFDLGSLIQLTSDLMVDSEVLLFFTLSLKLFLTVMTLNRGLLLVVVTEVVLFFTLVLKLFLTVMILIIGLYMCRLHYMPFIVGLLAGLAVLFYVYFKFLSGTVSFLDIFVLVHWWFGCGLAVLDGQTGTC